MEWFLVDGLIKLVLCTDIHHDDAKNRMTGFGRHLTELIHFSK